MANTYLQRTGISAGNRRIWTWSAWIKRTSIGEQRLFNHEQSSGTSQISVLKWDGNDNLLFADNTGSGNSINLNASLRKFRDTNAWYHIVLRIDTTDSTSNDRARIYLNGLDMRTNPDGHGYSSYTQPSQDYDTFANQSGNKITLGAWVNNTNQYFDGIMSHVVYTDGYSYGPEQFGETDTDTGEWKFKVPTGISYGTNGFYILKDGNGVTDQSGQGNNFSVGGGNLTNTEDSPSNIFATWNNLWAQSNGNVGDVTFSNGSTTTTTTTSYRTTPASLGMFGSGKYYWEIKRNEDDGNDLHAGVMSEDATPANTATWIGNAANGWVLAGDAGQPYTGGTGGSVISNTAFANSGDIHMCAYDASTGKLYFGANGTWGGTANPSTGANPHYTLDTSKVYFPCVSTGSDCSANFGNGYFGTTAVSSAGTNASNIGIFEYDVPTGFTALSTKGINSF